MEIKYRKIKDKWNREDLHPVSIKYCCPNMEKMWNEQYVNVTYNPVSGKMLPKLAIHCYNSYETDDKYDVFPCDFCPSCGKEVEIVELK